VKTQKAYFTVACKMAKNCTINTLKTLKYFTTVFKYVNLLAVHILKFFEAVKIDLLSEADKTKLRCLTFDLSLKLLLKIIH
jgi:hypothetical protein